MKLAFPKAPVTQRQKSLIKKLYDQLELPHPDFKEMNREQAYNLIDGLLHDKETKDKV